MGLMYSVAIDQLNLDRMDLFEITPATNKPIKIHGLYWGPTGGSYGTADVGDANEEFAAFQIIRGYTASGSGGSTPTPRPVDPTNATAASFTIKTGNTTLASGGTPLTIHSDGFNLRIRDALIWADAAKLLCTSAEGTIVGRFPNRPGNVVSFSATLYVEELGILNV